MKRNPALQPLSREHHTALTLAKACERAARSGVAEQVSAACQRAIRAYAIELEPHFLIEEQSLLPLLESAETQRLVQRTLADHQQLQALLKDLQQSNAYALERFGACLSAHVRFEERELFPALESVLTPR
ncbi:MAG: hemerythrin domain-containing protein [Gallionella sp.]|nr:hemerythrin domain-containing protein [Gallionella sp.]